MTATYTLWISGGLNCSHPQRMVAGEEAEAGPWGQEESTSHIDISGMVQAFTRARSAL